MGCVAREKTSIRVQDLGSWIRRACAAMSAAPRPERRAPRSGRNFSDRKLIEFSLWLIGRAGRIRLHLCPKRARFQAVLNFSMHIKDGGLRGGQMDQQNVKFAMK